MSMSRCSVVRTLLFVAVVASLCRGVFGSSRRRDAEPRLQRDCVPKRLSPSSSGMDFDYDVVIVGGAFSGAATALLLKRKQPTARVLIIEKTPEFDRKVGESTTELSSC